LSGLKGSGVESLLKQVYLNQNGLKCAVIVDEIDYEGFAETFDENEIEIEEEFVKFKNGCLCCTAGEDLSKEVTKIANEGNFDNIIILCSGV
jgi:G3E family GTPase